MSQSSSSVAGEHSQHLVEFLNALSLKTLPEIAVRKARIHLLDSLGCGLFGATTPWGKIAAEVMLEEGAPGAATLYGYATPVAPARAALVNGTATHGFELDDAAPGHVHPGSVVVPAVLALAEHFAISGQSVLLGIVGGYEAASRTGRAVGEVAWSLHTTGLIGVVGATVGAAIVLELPTEQTLRAIGIACSCASGIKSFTQGTGGMVKRMHAGRAAEAGVLSCLLARRGFTAPLAALDGKFGLIEAFGIKEPNPSLLDQNLGKDYVISNARIKAYPFCYGIHTTAQALHGLRMKHSIQPQAVRSIRIGSNKRAPSVHSEVAPKETMAAQYSMPYIAGVALARDPKDPRCFIGDSFNDPVVCELARKVTIEVDAEIDAGFPARFGTRVTVTLDDGRILESVVHNAKGMPEDPCSDEEVRQKFISLATVSHSMDAANSVLSLVDKIESLSNMAELSQVLRGGLRAA